MHPLGKMDCAMYLKLNTVCVCVCATTFHVGTRAQDTFRDTKGSTVVPTSLCNMFVV